MKTTRHLAVFLVLAAPFAFAADPAATPDAPAAPAAKPAALVPYPLAVCIVTDNDLDSMGDATRLVHGGREIKFCCAPCEAKFLKNPARFLKKLEPAPAPAPAS